jgi:hypothetical protein
MCSCRAFQSSNRPFLRSLPFKKGVDLFPAVVLYESSFPWEPPLPDQDEETLLRINLSIISHSEDALVRVQKYTQGFPFAAVLPVQPLQYLPTAEGGVEVLFLRKKTKEKGSIDGGMKFFVKPGIDSSHIEIVVKRNSEGQTISKLFTEKLVVSAYCSGIKGEEDERFGKSPSDIVAIESIFHRWM